jgi:hypothetical protein
VLQHLKTSVLQLVTDEPAAGAQDAASQALLAAACAANTVLCISDQHTWSTGSGNCCCWGRATDLGVFT